MCNKSKSSVDRREVLKGSAAFAVSASVIAMTPASTMALAEPVPQLSPKIVESRTLIMEAMTRLRKVQVAIAGCERFEFVTPDNIARVRELHAFCDEEKAARNALHMAVTGGSVCVKPQTSYDCDEQLQFLNYLGELHEGSSSRPSNDGLREIIEHRRSSIRS